MSYDLAAIRARLDDPFAIATALGRIDGRRSYRRLARGILVRCPAHAERTPSCSLSPSGDGVLFHCFGCDASGDVFDLIAVVAGLDRRTDFRRVVEIAAQLAGVGEDDDVPRFTPPPPPPEPPRLDLDTFDALAAVIQRHGPVAGEPDVAAYVAGRALTAAAPELAALPATDAGYDRLIDAIVADVGEDAWLRSGLATARGSFLFPEHRLVAFWREPDGRVRTVQRRRVAPAAPGDTVGKYVFASRRPPAWPYGVEHAETLGPAGAVAFCEGFVDALALRLLCRRVGADVLALGLPGTAGWSQPWAQLAVGRVAVVALDDDDAGERKAPEIAHDLIAAGAADVRREVPPEGAKDWAEALARREAAA